MRILHVHTRYRNPGGEDTVVDGERSLLRSVGFDLATLDFQNPQSKRDSLVTLARAPWNRGAAARVVDAANSHSADLVHIHNTWFALSPSAVPALRQAGFPVAVTFHNYRLVCVNALLFRDGQPCETCVGGSTFPGIAYRCYRRSLGASAVASATIQLHRTLGTWTKDLSVAVVLTEFARSILLNGGLPPDRTVVKPNFVSDPGHRPIRPSESSEVLFVGRLSHEKGIDSLIEAWKRVRLEGLELVVIGSGPKAEEVRKSSGFGVRLLGWLSPQEVMSRMLAARALVVPSLSYEVQPMVLLEALAAGLPVFHTDLGALSETCGKGGLSIGSGGVPDMVSGLEAMADDGLLDTKGQKARAEYERRFSPASSLGAIQHIYEMARRDGR